MGRNEEEGRVKEYTQIFGLGGWDVVVFAKERRW